MTDMRLEPIPVHLSQDEEQPHRKDEHAFLESARAEQRGTDGGDIVPQLSQAHQKYLLERHGTIELDPTPCMDEADPYNWPEWKVCALSPRKFTNHAICSPHKIKL